MRIVVVISAYHPRWGGAENQARKQAHGLARRGHSVEVITWRHDASWPREEDDGGVLIKRVDRAPGHWGALRSALGMTRTLVAAVRGTDAVIGHQMLVLPLLAAAIAAIWRKPVAVKAAITEAAVESDLRLVGAPSIGGQLRRLLSLPLRRRGVAVAISQEIARDLSRLGFRRVALIPNGVEGGGTPDRASLRAELFEPLSVPAGVPVVAAAGRLIWWKGFDLLLQAWAHARLRNAVLVVVGSGPDEARLRHLADRLGIAHKVRFLPASSDAGRYLAAADVVVLPSLYEGMSNVLLEAMAAAVPVVATAVSGSVDLIVDGENGRLVPPSDPEALASALRATLENPSDLGARGRETVLALCEIGRVVNLYESLLTNLARLPEGILSAGRLSAYARSERRPGSRDEGEMKPPIRSGAYDRPG